MKIKETIGIDVSKSTLDACIHSSQVSATFENSKKGFTRLVKWAYGNSPHPSKEVFFTLICRNR
jgi:transposase